MKSFTILSLLFGASAIDTANTETRGLHDERGGGGRHGGGGHHKGRHHGGGHINHTHKNMTDWLNQTCTKNNITCVEVSDNFLANCTYHHHDHHGSSQDTNYSISVEDEDLVELSDMIESAGDEDNAWDEILSTELGGTDRNLIQKRRRHHGGGGVGERYHGPKSGKWGNLTDAEIDALKLKHLTCKCCGNHTGG